MGRWWKWFVRVGRVAADLVGKVLPEGCGAGRSLLSGRLVGVPDGPAAPRCGGAVGVARNQRAGSYALLPSGGGCRRRGSGVGEGRRADG
ncbi:hypothetical protein GA0070623_0643 [Micromonospora rifamycinica]|uniref:Uncharacterized protein n=1 Tax=Micromonospora rifamycinica TaxID=291594 RepID=A0A1C5H2X6_9ACTN|nr:hypothetical protein GA0070623_0643 [Micromonospora rifamycinica]